MARTYWIRGESSVADGDPLDAHLTKVLMQGNVESVYEEARNDHCIILQAEEACDADWYFGPHPILMRRDRDGRFRSPKIQPLAGGTADLYCFITDRYFEPSATIDDYIEWSVASANTEWQTAQEFTMSIHADPLKTTFPDGDEMGYVRRAFVVFNWHNISASPTFSGFRLIEQVDVS